MSNFKCNECGYMFDTPKKFVESTGHDHYKITTHVCPKCNGDDFVELVTCDECGNEVPHVDTCGVTINGKRRKICDECYIIYINNLHLEE